MTAPYTLSVSPKQPATVDPLAHWQAGLHDLDAANLHHWQWALEALWPSPLVQRMRNAVDTELAARKQVAA